MNHFEYKYHLIAVCHGLFCLLQKALAATDATYAPGTGPLKGVVSCEGVDLPISSTAGQLWATELATLYQTAQDAAQDRTRRYRWAVAAACYSAVLPPARPLRQWLLKCSVNNSYVCLWQSAFLLACCMFRPLDLLVSCQVTLLGSRGLLLHLDWWSAFCLPAAYSKAAPEVRGPC